MVSPVEAYIRQRAPAYGIDPNVAVTVATGEGGLFNPFRHGEGPAPRSQAARFGRLENSFGPFQLYISGNGAGLGDRALAAGIDPRENWQGGIDYALNEASQKGWGQWYGAKAKGITGFEGIGGRPANAPAPYQGAPPVMDGPKGDEQVRPAGYSTRPQGPVEAAGGGYGSDPVNPAMQPPLAGGRNGLASVMAGQAGTPGAASQAPAAAPKKKSFLAALGEGLGAMGDAVGGGGGGGGPMRAATPQAARMDAPAPVSPIDTQQADQQRQLLALALQRLNSGRLF
jgi:hypothetical protein